MEVALYPSSSIAKGGHESQNPQPPIGPNFLVIFTTTLTKRPSGAYPQHYHQGRSQKWPKEEVLGPEIAKGGGFGGVEALRIRARTSFS